MNILNAWRFQRLEQTLTPINYIKELQPNKIGLAENILSFEFRPAFASGVSGTRASIRIQILGNPTSGFVFTISNGRGDSFSANASLTPNAGEYVTFTGSNNLSRQFQIAQSLAYELNDSVFGTFYDISAESNNLVITAKEFGAEFNLSYSNNGFFFVTNSTSGSNNFAVDAYIDYSLYGEVHVLNSFLSQNTKYNVYGSNVDRFAAIEAGRISMPFRGTNWLFNIDGYLKDYVGIVLPGKNANLVPNVYELDKDTDKPIMRAYFVSLGDSFRYVFNAEKKRYITRVTDVLYVQNGASDLLREYDLNKFVLIGNGAPLTLMNQYEYKDTRLDSNEYVQFILDVSSIPTTCAYGVEVTFNFVDGTSVTRDFVLGDLNDLWGGNTSIDISPRKLGVDTEEASGIWVDNYSVRVWWQQPTFPRFYSGVKRFRYKRECGEEVLSFIWFNDFGAWDSIDVKGNKQVKEATRDRVSVQRAIPLKPNPSYDVTRVVNNNYQEVYSANTFEVDKANYRLAEGLIKSTAVYYYDKKLNAFIPVLVTESDWSDSANKDVNVVNFKYTLTYNTNTITQ